MSKQKPYISKRGQEWAVLDCNGKETFKSSIWEEAFQFWNANWEGLLKGEVA